MTKVNIKNINKIQNFPIERVVSHLGVEVSKSGKFACPFHQDAIPTMKIVKAKNKCFCVECKKEASAIDLVMRYLGYVDVKEAVDYLLNQSNLTSSAYSNEKHKVQHVNANVKVEKRTKILTEFYWTFASELPASIKNILMKKYKIDPSFLTTEYLGWLDLDDHHILYALFQQWTEDDLIGCGLIKRLADSTFELLFKDHRLIFPYRDFREFYSAKKIRGHKLVPYVKGAALDKEGKHSYIGTDLEDFWFYNMDKVDWSKKILICEGVLNVLSVLSNSKLYSAVGVNRINIKADFIDYFKQSDVTIAFDHKKALKGETQSNISNIYHKDIHNIIELFKKRTNQTPNVMKTSIGVELVEYFKRYRKG